MDSWQFNSYSIIYLLAAAMSIIISVIAWKMRPARASSLFSLLALATGIWVTGYLLGFFSKDINFKLIMLRIEYLGILSSGYLWILFASTYTHYDKWLKPWVKIALAVIPLLSYLQIIFVDYHDFFYEEYTITQVNDLIVTKKIYGIGFYIETAYNYLAIITGAIFLIQRIIKMPSGYRNQNIILIIGILIIIVPNFLYITGNNPIAPYDPTPLSFALIGILFLIAIYFHRFLDVVPVAYNLVFKNLKNGVLIIDIKARIIGMNSAAQQIFNCTIKQCIGKPVIELFPGSEKHVKDYIAEEEVKAEITIGKDKHVYELQISPLKDYSDILIGQIVMLYDINEQKRAFEELDAFSRTVAHDLKNPLSTIIGFSDLLTGKKTSSEKIDSYIKNINISANKMDKIIDALLIMAKVRDDDRIVKSVLDMDDIVNSAITRLSDFISELHAEIIRPDKWELALGDPVLIEEVWVNFISNALKYSGKPPVIELSSVLIEDKVHLKIRDNGDSIDEEEQKIIFAEFSRLQKNKNHISGHGLGLSINQRIIKKLGGETGVHSLPEKGNEFYFTLPAFKN